MFVIMYSGINWYENKRFMKKKPWFFVLNKRYNSTQENWILSWWTNAHCPLPSSQRKKKGLIIVVSLISKMASSVHGIKDLRSGCKGWVTYWRVQQRAALCYRRILLAIIAHQTLRSGWLLLLLWESLSAKLIRGM